MIRLKSMIFTCQQPLLKKDISITTYFIQPYDTAKRTGKYYHFILQ